MPACPPTSLHVCVGESFPLSAGLTHAPCPSPPPSFPCPPPLSCSLHTHTYDTAHPRPRGPGRGHGCGARLCWRLGNRRGEGAWQMAFTPLFLPLDFHYRCPPPPPHSRSHASLSSPPLLSSSLYITGVHSSRLSVMQLAECYSTARRPVKEWNCTCQRALSPRQLTCWSIQWSPNVFLSASTIVRHGKL